jgi:hypothetical protein
MSICPETSTKLYVHEFGFQTKLESLQHSNIVNMQCTDMLSIFCCRRQLKLYTSVKVGHSRTSDLFYIRRFGDYTVIVTTTLRDDIWHNPSRSYSICIRNSDPVPGLGVKLNLNFGNRFFLEFVIFLKEQWTLLRFRKLKWTQNRLISGLCQKFYFVWIRIRITDGVH